MSDTTEILVRLGIQTGSSGNNIKSLRTEAKALKDALGKVEEGSQDFITLAKRAGEVRDQMDDVNATVKAFNPEAKFQAFSAVVGGLANGFQAAQGAMALFGSENSKLTEAIAKTQGAMALANGLNGIMGMKDSLKILGAQVKSTIPLLRSFSTAMLGALTGGVAIAIGVIIAYWRDIAKWLGFATESQEEYNKRLEENIEINKKAQDQFSRLRDMRNKQIKDDRQRELAEAKARRDDLKKQIQEEQALKQGSAYATSQLLKENEKLYRAEIEKINKEFDKKAEDLRITRAEDEAKRKKTGVDQEIALFDLQTQRLKKQAEEEGRNVNDVVKDRLQDRQLLEEKAQLETRQKYEAQLKERLTTIEDAQQRERTSLMDSLDKQEQAINDFYTRGRISKQAYDASITELDNKRRDAQLANMETVADALQNIGNVATEGTIVNKGLGVASATIDTYVGANKALAQGGALGFIAAAGVIAAGIANVRKILSVKVPGGGDSGSAPSGSMPQAPVRPSSSMIALTPQNTVQTQQVGLTKVYVLEQDIRKATNNVASIEAKATIK